MKDIVIISHDLDWKYAEEEGRVNITLSTGTKKGMEQKQRQKLIFSLH